MAYEFNKTGSVKYSIWKDFIPHLDLMFTSPKNITILGPKFFLVHKKFWVRTNYGSVKNVGSENFYVQKKFKPKQNVGQKNWGPKSVWAKIILCP